MDLINEILSYLKGFGDLDNMAKVAAVLMTLISIWKSSLLQPYWDKLGALKVWVAPILGAALAIVQLWPEPFTWPALGAALLAGLKTGALSIAFFQLLQTLKSMPVIGEKYKAIIEFFENLLMMPEEAKEKELSK